MIQESYQIPTLPLSSDVETRAVLKAVARARSQLAEFKGLANSIPNKAILISTLTIQEAMASSEIEAIVTTQDELFEAGVIGDRYSSKAAKEVARYQDALQLGYRNLQVSQGIISNRSLIQMFQLLKSSTAEFRTTPGTSLINDQTGETVFVPPQDHNSIIKHMTNLEQFINDSSLSDLDDLVKMAIIHHQFESIHPFYDGNGRLGRILNVLYLSKVSLLDDPILYFSRVINAEKSGYYKMLQYVRDTGDWEPWILFMVISLGSAALQGQLSIWKLKNLLEEFKHSIRSNLPKIYSQDLLNNLFKFPYTKIDFLQKDLNVSRQTASRYLDALAENGYLSVRTSGNSKYFVNHQLVQLLKEIGA